MDPEPSDLIWQIRRIQGTLNDFSALLVDEVGALSVRQESALGAGLPLDRFADDECDCMRQPDPSSTSIFLRVDFDGKSYDSDAMKVAQSLTPRSLRRARCFRVYVERSFDTVDAHPEDDAEQAFSVIGNENHILLDKMVTIELD